MTTPVVIDIGRRDVRRVLIGGAVTGALGVAALVGAVTAYADGEGVGGTIGLVIGLAFTAITLGAIVNWKRISRPRKLVLEMPGVRWDDPAGTPWAVAWPELGGVRISRTRERVFHPADSVVRKTMVRLDLLPADPPTFQARHADMAHLARQDGVYRLPLGDAAALITVVERAVLGFAPHLYRGVQDEGFTVGLS
ncbi:hypothetical protein B0I31_101620 [Saccharothrix carnea]|uniref:PH (Pleckstrin Homology) domain-containing protein n=1 Tax=Saccharothrix carnea TaxID=1280637 RepID=A0A2P8IIV0_SACCR|nr:hypothetical protein [Saccharothrix carnea]PSL58402.1 hypothetical protein B0I31_101620 [Saccharothrix carnea]